VESLIPVKQTAQKYNDQPITVILLHCSHYPDSVTDLLFYSSERVLKKKLTGDFQEACAILRNKYRNIVSLRIELFHGKTKSAFRNFLNAHSIAEICTPKYYRLKLGSDCFDPLPFIRESDITICEAEWQEQPYSSLKSGLTILFSD
jgi:hypothetical protein